MPATVGLTNPIFTDLEAARQHFEAIRWPEGTYCPFCGSFDRVAALGGKSMGPGWYHCKDCRKKFTAAVGTIYERSHIPMTKWLLATHLMCASKKGMSAHQLHRMIDLPYKTAWFMARRIREGMRDLSPAPTPMGGAGETVEADETYIGGKEKNKHRSKRNGANIGGMGKEIAFALVERGGRVRTEHVANVTAKTLRDTLVTQLHADTKLMTDDAGQYRHMHKDFAHEVVNRKRQAELSITHI
ncbi:IS1595 family transposase [Bradyrhizobium elkanii]|uniref:IS1595 family transposase n=1 Tax=Bradyrhizobium elkanii TaxID=29448 RepID=UPI0027154D3C|nr:IS1595 family transposase [Bradyrhizobium elkanii]WLB84982.1 IS1595 family transposase [Bradyrhizobium elkanii]